MRPSHKPYIVVGIVFLAALLFAGFIFVWQRGGLPLSNPFSETATPIETTINETPASGETIPQSYEWSYGGHEWTWNLQIPEGLYLYYHAIERAPVSDYSIYVTHPLDDSFIKGLAEGLKSRATERGFDEEETANFVASFVQNLDYQSEEGEYPKYPVETLFDRGGDCEDTSILTAALLQAMEYDVVLLNFPPVPPDEAGHMAVGVALPAIPGGYKYNFDGEDYYYLETTSVSKAGEIPDNYRGRDPTIYKILPIPVLKFTDELRWTTYSKWLAEDTLTLEVTVTNWGTADAEGVYVRAFFVGDEDKAKTSAPFDLKYGYQISPVTVEKVVMPAGGGTICVELFEGGVKVEEWIEQVS